MPPGSTLPFAVVVAGLAAAGAIVLGQEPAATPATGGESEVDELARRSTDPTASPMTFAFLNDVTALRWVLEDGARIDQTGYEFKFQRMLPFKAWGIANILRMTLPYQVTGPGPEGVGDITVIDLVVFGQFWGCLGSR